MNFKIKLDVFLVNHRHILNVIIPCILSVLLSEFNMDSPTMCNGNEDPCKAAFEESLKDLEQQKQGLSRAARLASNTAFGGKKVTTGTGVVESEGSTYIAQTAEVTDSDGKVLRRITDCMRGDNKKS